MVNYCVNLLGVAEKKGHPNEKFGDFMPGSLGFFFSFVSWSKDLPLRCCFNHHHPPPKKWQLSHPGAKRLQQHFEGRPAIRQFVQDLVSPRCIHCLITVVPCDSPSSRYELSAFCIEQIHNVETCSFQSNKFQISISTEYNILPTLKQSVLPKQTEEYWFLDGSIPVVGWIPSLDWLRSNFLAGAILLSRYDNLWYMIWKPSNIAI